LSSVAGSYTPAGPVLVTTPSDANLAAVLSGTAPALPRSFRAGPEMRELSVEEREADMAKRVVLTKNIPANELKRMKEIFTKLGATDIKEEKNADGTFNLEGAFDD
jgi:hypothetical protein